MQSAPSESPLDRKPWHAEALDDVFTSLETRIDGLNEDEAARRLVRVGPNRLDLAPRRGWMVRLAAQFNNVLIVILLVAATVTAALGHSTDTAVIIGVVIINALIGFLQEGKAERALGAIRDLLAPTATVVRGGERMVIDAAELIPGDVIVVEPGDKAPADARLFQARNLQAQEAPLTGEALAVEKGVAANAVDAALGDRSSLLHAGTMIATGHGRAVVVATGRRTEIGRITTLLADVETLQTPLLRQIAAFSRWLTAAIISVAGLTFAFGVWGRGFEMDVMFTAAVGLAVAAIPEGLPAIMTITLAIGVQRMARRKAIIRRLPAVETLGAVTVICSDKTGTLTRNEMTVQSVITRRHVFDISGVGYIPAGAYHLDGAAVSLDDHPLLRDMARGAVLCSDAAVRDVEGTWVCNGDPTEGALVVAAMKAGLTPAHVHERFPRTDEMPFESEHRFMATLHHQADGTGTIYIKGAPERLLELCHQHHGPDGDEPIDHAYWLAQAHDAAAGGQRVIALARRAVAADHRVLDIDDLEDGLVLLGLFGLADPPREDAVIAAELAQSAGVRVKMITGDHAATARAVAEQIGLANTATVMTGAELDDLDDAALAARVMDTDVFARTSPAHKLRLVTALQAQGNVVAMTGDGVNDAPALKRADVGVAMGAKGTEAAKEASEMVLADDNFASITHAVEEGRTVYDNLLKAIVFILPTNGGEALSILAAVAMGGALPITAVQILWVNMITAVTLALVLAFEPTEDDVMRRAPRRADAPILSGFLIWRTVFVSVVLVVGVFGLFQYERSLGTDLETARAVAVTTLVLFEVFYLFNCRHLTARAGLGRNIKRPLLAVAVVIVAQAAFVHVPAFQGLFGTAALDAAAWGRAVLVASSVFVLVEVEKALLRWRSVV